MQPEGGLKTQSYHEFKKVTEPVIYRLNRSFSEMIESIQKRIQSEEELTAINQQHRKRLPHVIRISSVSLVSKN
jgi:hypothetical protein